MTDTEKRMRIRLRRLKIVQLILQGKTQKKDMAPELTELGYYRDKEGNIVNPTDEDVGRLHFDIKFLWKEKGIIKPIDEDTRQHEYEVIVSDLSAILKAVF